MITLPSCRTKHSIRTSGDSRGSFGRWLNFERLEDRRLLTAGDRDLSFAVGGVAQIGFPSPDGPGAADDWTIEAAFHDKGNDPGVVALIHGGGNAVGVDRIVRLDQHGNPDQAFGGLNGFDPSEWLSSYTSSVVAQGERLLIAGLDGAGNVTVIRLDTDGALDETFAANGILATDITGEWPMIDVVDNGFVVSDALWDSGNPMFDVLVARFNEDGTPDDDFGTAGREIVEFEDGVFVHDTVTDGDELVVTSSDGYAYRFGPEGRDMTFGDNGVISLGPVDLITSVDYANQQLVVAKNVDFPGPVTLQRINDDGTLDATFGANGEVVLSQEAIGVQTGAIEVAHEITVLPDGKIAVLAFGRSLTHRPTTIVRLHADGSTDCDFGVNGAVLAHPMTRGSYWTGDSDGWAELVTDPQGNLVAIADVPIGARHDVAFAKFGGDLNAPGSNCPAITGPFADLIGPGSVIPGPLYDFAVIGGGSGVADGPDQATVRDTIGFEYTLTASDPSPSLEADGFSYTVHWGHDSPTDEFVIDAASHDTGSDQGVVALVRSQGSIGETSRLIRVDQEGDPDPAFGGADGIDVSAWFATAPSTLVAQGNMVLIAGADGSGLVTLVRLTNAGIPDWSFGIQGVLTTDIVGSSPKVGIHADGFVVTAAVPESGNPTSSDIVVARYLDDGSVDSDFGTDGKEVLDFANNDQPLELDMDGAEFLVTLRSGLISRFNIAGRDASFGDNDGALNMGNNISAVAYVGGMVLVAKNTEPVTLQRFHSDGTPDATFGDNGTVEISAEVLDGASVEIRAVQDIVELSNGAVGVLMFGEDTVILNGHFSPFWFEGFNYPLEFASRNPLMAVRLLSDGSRDATFGDQGMAVAVESTRGSIWNDANGGWAKLIVDDQYNLRVVGEEGARPGHDVSITAFDASGIRDQTYGNGGARNVGFHAPNMTEVARTPGNGSGVTLSHVFDGNSLDIGDMVAITITATNSAASSTTSVFHVSVESVVVMPGPFNERVVVADSSGNDTVEVEIQNYTETRVSVNGVDYGWFPTSQVAFLLGRGGSDTLTRLGTHDGSILVLGSDGPDDITVVGNGAGRIQVQPGAGNDSISLTHDKNIDVIETFGHDQVILFGSPHEMAFQYSHHVDLRGNDEYTLNLSTPVPILCPGPGGSEDDWGIRWMYDPLGVDSLLVNGSPAKDRIRKDGGQIQVWSDGAPCIAKTYSFVDGPPESVTIDGKDGDDYIQDPGEDTVILGGRGNDTIVIDATTGTGVTADGGEDSDTIVAVLGSLAGPVTVLDSGNTGNDALIVEGTTSADHIDVAATSVTAAAENVIYSTSIESLTVNGGEGDDELSVSSSGTSTVTVDGQDGVDNVSVQLGNLAAPITLDDTGVGEAGTVTVLGTDGNDTIGVSTAGVSSSGQAVNLTGPVGTLIVDAGAGNDSVGVTELAGNTGNLELVGGTGTDTFALDNVGSSVGSLEIDGGGDNDQVTVQGGLPSDTEVENIAPTVTVAGPSTGVRGRTCTFLFQASDLAPGDNAFGFEYSIDWGDGSPVQVVPATSGNGSGISVDHAFTQPGPFTVSVVATDLGGEVSMSATALIAVDVAAVIGSDFVVGGTDGDDIIHFAKVNGSVKVFVNGDWFGPFVAQGRMMAYGGPGNDLLSVGALVNRDGWLFGGDGNDLLNGGTGDDMLEGDAGNDLAFGGFGRDVIIGGDGSDSLFGNFDEDIIIAGSTAHDGDETALEMIMAEWKSNRSFANRVANLQGTDTGQNWSNRANGQVFLISHPSSQSVTVFDDDDRDVLVGGLGTDWFFANLSGGGVQDCIADLNWREVATDLVLIDGLDQ